MRHALRAVTVLMMVLVFVGAAPAQSEYHEQIRVQLGSFESVLLEQGFEQTHDFHIDALDDDARNSFTVILRDDMDYKIVSVCDQDCTDLDLYLYDENDSLIDEDETEDDIPVMDASPRWTGQFSIEVAMYACSANPCFFGIGVFGRPR